MLVICLHTHSGLIYLSRKFYQSVDGSFPIKFFSSYTITPKSNTIAPGESVFSHDSRQIEHPLHRTNVKFIFAYSSLTHFLQQTVYGTTENHHRHYGLRKKISSL